MLANRFQRLLVNLTIPVECFYLTPSHIVDECRAPSIKERDPLAGLLTMMVVVLMMIMNMTAYQARVCDSLASRH